MSDEAETPAVNLTRAMVMGKIPNAKGPTQQKSPKMTTPRKAHARRLRKRGLISEKAAAKAGLDGK